MPPAVPIATVGLRLLEIDYPSIWARLRAPFVAGTAPTGAAQNRPLLAMLIGLCALAGLALASRFADLWDADAPAGALAELGELAFGVAAIAFASRAHAFAPAASPPDRSAAETIAELRQAKETAESVNLAKSRYLANVSHEIRSPLNAIYGYAQLVESDYGVEAQEAARVIRRCAEHMSSLIEGLLDISQVEHGVLRVNTETVRLDAFISQLLRMVRPSAVARGLELNFVSEGRLPEFVRMDQGRLRQVLINLLGNAIKYTDQGSVTLWLRYAGQIATIEVRDTGPGIRAEDRDSIFDPFDRGGEGPAHSRPGAGLGLSISRAITSILGGELVLAASDERGSVFRVTMMLGEASGAAQDARAQRQVIGYQGPRRSVLVVDDDPEQRGFVAHLLGRIGFDVVMAADGEAAERLATDQAFDLAILDITMPGITGWDLAGRLHAGGGRRPQILMLSGNSSEMHGPEFRAQLHDHFLIKPVEFGMLTEAIGGLLDLSWVVAMPEVEADSGPATGLTLAAPDDETREHLRQLRELLRIGYLRGIEAEIGQLEEHAPDLARQLFVRLDRLDIAAMIRLLDEVDA